MYSHLASNDQTGPLDFVDPNGWFLSTVVEPIAGSSSAYGKEGSIPWIEIQTYAGPFRLNGVAWTVKSGSPPANTATTIYLAVSANSYIEVAAGDDVVSIFSHTHQTSFDNVYGNGTKPTVAEVFGAHPVDLLSPNAMQRIDGTKFGDTILLNDMGGTAYSNNGKDSVTGGGGNDLMFGGKGKDYLFGEGAQDELHGDNGNDALYGGGDNDDLYGGADKDTAYGDDGQDTIYGEWQKDLLYGGDDDDTVSGGDDNDRLYGGGGQDKLYGDKGNDKLYGEDDNDELYGAAGNDKLYAGIGQDKAYGDVGNDRIYGDADNDTLYGGKGNDKLYGGIGQDTLFGDDGNDRIYGDADNDVLQGYGGNDRLFGGIGQDVLFGSWGKDKLKGEDDNDRLDGGFDADVLTGGGGANQFVFSTKLGKGNIDKITDFKVGFDSIELSDTVFKALTAGPLPETAFHRGAKAHDADDRIVYNPKNGLLIYDGNGDKKGGAQIFATLDDGLALSHTDFFVI
jgi:Ca2+-binding RTX toxin-like protein